MKINRFFFLIIFFFIFFLFPARKVNAIDVEYIFYSTNASNIIWEAGFRFLDKFGGNISSTYTVDVDRNDLCSRSNTYCYVDEMIGAGAGIASTNDLRFQWGTGCIDPIVNPSSLGFGPGGSMLTTDYINITLSNSNLNSLSGIDPNSYNFVNDIQWYENNAGRTYIPFVDFNTISSCPRRPAYSCSRTNPGRCAQSNCNPATDNNCYANNSCGGTQCEGPISGQVFLPNGNPLNGAEVDRNGGTNQTTRNISGANGSFRWTGLNIFSNHTVRLIRFSYEQCA